MLRVRPPNRYASRQQIRASAVLMRLIIEHRRLCKQLSTVFNNSTHSTNFRSQCWSRWPAFVGRTFPPIALDAGIQHPFLRGRFPLSSIIGRDRHLDFTWVGDSSYMTSTPFPFSFLFLSLANCMEHFWLVVTFGCIYTCSNAFPRHLRRISFGSLTTLVHYPHTRSRA